MEKTIAQTPKKPIETKNSLEVHLKRFKKHGSETFARIVDLDYDKGIITFVDLDGKLQTIDTNTEILAYLPGTKYRFGFVKPVIFLHSYTQQYGNGKEFYDEDSGEYVFSNDDVFYRMDDIYVFYKFVQRYANCSSTSHEELIESHTGLNLAENTYQKTYVCSAIEGKSLGYVCSNLMSISESNSTTATINERRILFVDGQKIVDKDIEDVKVENKIYVGELLKPYFNKRAYVQRSKGTRKSGLKKLEETLTFKDLYSFAEDYFARPLEVKDKSWDTKEIVLKDWINNSFENARVMSDYSDLYLNISTFVINYYKREIICNSTKMLPTVIRHMDCCGAHLPYHHGYGDSFWNTLSKSTYSKLYTFYIRQTKADFTIFLTEKQIPTSLAMYTGIFGEDAVKLIHSYPNMNSGNMIFMYYINTTLRIQKFGDIALAPNKSDWAHRSKISEIVGRYINTSKQTVHELTQWFENSEEVIEIEDKKVNKPKETIRQKATSRSRRSATVTPESLFGFASLRNYSTR